MCATVPSIPVVLMVPLTDLSAAMTMVPDPVADEVTGGVSSAPTNFTLTSVAEAEPTMTASAAATISARLRWVLKNAFIVHSCLRSHFEKIHGVCAADHAGSFV